MRGWHFILLGGILGLLVLFYEGLWGDPKAIPTVLIGTPAPGFSATELGTGRTISLSEFQGKVVVLNFWASWCQECRLEQQNLLEIQNEFGNNPNFLLLGVDYHDRDPDAKRYLDVFGSNFHHIVDPSGVIAIDYGVYGVPETFVFDQKGIIRHKVVGPIAGSNYKQLVEQVIRPLLEGQRS